MTTDPLLAWHEAFVSSGYEVESLVTDDMTRAFAAFGTLDGHRLVLWRGFNDGVNVLVESAGASAPLVCTWRKEPSGGTRSFGWFGEQWVATYVGNARPNRTWRFGDFVRNQSGFIQMLTNIRSAIRGNVTVDADDRRHAFMRDRLVVALDIFRQRHYTPPESWLSALGRTPGSPRPA